MASVISIVWFAKNFTAALGYRIAAEDNGCGLVGYGESTHDIGGLAKGKRGNQFCRAAAAANTLRFIHLGHALLETVTGLDEEFLPLRRATGKNQ